MEDGDEDEDEGGDGDGGCGWWEARISNEIEYREVPKILLGIANFGLAFYKIYFSF